MAKHLAQYLQGIGDLKADASKQLSLKPVSEMTEEESEYKEQDSPYFDRMKRTEKKNMSWGPSEGSKNLSGQKIISQEMECLQKEFVQKVGGESTGKTKPSLFRIESLSSEEKMEELLHHAEGFIAYPKNQNSQTGSMEILSINQ